jgi:hypothetical protein
MENSGLDVKNVFFFIFILFLYVFFKKIFRIEKNKNKKKNLSTKLFAASIYKIKK